MISVLTSLVINSFICDNEITEIFILFFQKKGYDVCERIADRIGIRAKVVRVSFMYLTFVTLGFGFAFYLFLAFWLKVKDLIYTKRSSVFDL